MSVPVTTPKVLLFGTGETGSSALQYLLDENIDVVGLCSNCDVTQPSFLFKIKVFLVQKLFDWGMYTPHCQILHDFSKPIPDPSSMAKGNNIPCLDFRELKSDSFYNTVNKLKPDLILCFGFPKLVPQRILDTAQISAINIHPGFLPQRGGGTPVRWSIVKGDNKIGLTAHIMTSKFDAGKVICAESVPVLPDDNSVSLENKVISIFPKLMKEIWLRYENGDIEKNANHSEAPTIHPPLHNEYNKINWQKHGAEHIQRLTRAMRPKGSAYTYIQDRQLYLWDVSILEDDALSQGAQPGQIIHIEKNGDCVIKTVNGCLRVHSFLFGYKIRSTKFIIQRFNLKIGQIFSSQQP